MFKVLDLRGSPLFSFTHLSGDISTSGNGKYPTLS